MVALPHVFLVCHLRESACLFPRVQRAVVGPYVVCPACGVAVHLRESLEPVNLACHERVTMRSLLE